MERAMRVASAIQALCCGVLVVCVVSVATAQNAPPPGNEIFDKLMKDGITLSNGEKEALPKPVMTDGLTAAAQLKVIEGLVPKERLASFRGGNLNDWHELKITGAPAKAAGQTSARHSDLYYIANGKLETVADKNFVKSTMTGGENNFHFLTTEELDARKIKLPADTNAKRERIAHAKLDLFNMVKVRSTGHGASTSAKDSQLTAFFLDDRFKEDKEFPNEYQTIKLDKQIGKKVISDPVVYQGAAGYMKVTRLVGTSQPQVFIESHLVFEEPFEWFSGQGTLTSKLPEKVRADVRSFRRDLQKFQQANPGAGVATAPAADKK
jgi:hypothetical protein